MRKAYPFLRDSHVDPEVFEMTRSYQVMLPLMLACTTGSVTAHAADMPLVSVRALARNRQDAGDDAQHLSPFSDGTQKQVRLDELVRRKIRLT